MSVKDTFKTWSAMETLIAVVGPGGAMAPSAVA
jgi:H+/gluconate symporter-like permease